jgi:hypothetical protein
MKKIKISIFLLNCVFVIFFTKCKDSNILYHFPTKDVFLDLQVDNFNPNNSELRFLKHDISGSTLFSFKTNSQFSKLKQLGQIAYVSVLLKYDNYNLDLLKIDLSSGIIKKTGIHLFDDFEITSNGEWICYNYNDYMVEMPEYPGLRSFFPVIILEKLNGKEKYIYDMKSEIKDGATIAEINIENNKFVISYFNDSNKPIHIGSIDIENHKFSWIK